MIQKIKKIIYDIITNNVSSIEEKYQSIINIFPHYLTNLTEKKTIYEKIEGIFHDGLGTYFELLVFNEIIEKYELKIVKSSINKAVKKINDGKKLYELFFKNNEYNINLSKEIANIEIGAKSAINIIKIRVGNKKIKNVTHSASDFSNGNARDIFITLESGEEINFSLKTDKSGKMAISDGQTPKIFEKVYNRYFNLNQIDYDIIKLELFKTTDESIIKKDFQNIALLTQTILIKQFNMQNAEINNFKYSTINNLENFQYFISQLKKYKNGKDDASVLLVNRITGEIGFESILDEIIDIKIEDISFTPTIPRSYAYATEPGIKYKGKTFISFQIKHKRGKNPSNEFCDITIRLRAK